VGEGGASAFLSEFVVGGGRGHEIQEGHTHGGGGGVGAS
jgi:hypothetical protein